MAINKEVTAVSDAALSALTAQAKTDCEAQAKEYNAAHSIEPVSYLLSEGFDLEQLEKLNKLLDVSYAELAARYDQASPTTKRQMRGQYCDDSGEADNEAPDTTKSKKRGPITQMDLYEHLDKRGLDVRYNVITHDIEYIDREGNFSLYNPETLHSEIAIILADELRSKFTGVTKDSIADLLTLIASINRYNPVMDIINSIVWDRQSRKAELADILCIPQDDELSRVLLVKWLQQCISLADNDPTHPYGADGILVLNGPQGIGKTTFVSKAALGIRELYKLGQYLDYGDKDTIRRCCSSWIVELGELESTLRKDIEKLKAFVTSDRDEYRLSYGRTDLKMIRRTSLIGTCNNTKFLVDPTGSRRFWTIPVQRIQLDKLNEFDFKQLWAEVYEDVKADRQCFRLTAKELASLTERNSEFEKPLKYQPECEDLLHTALTRSGYVFEYQTVTEFIATFSDIFNRADARQVGEVLTKLGINAEKRNGKRVRLLPKRTIDSRVSTYSKMNLEQ